MHLRAGVLLVALADEQDVARCPLERRGPERDRGVSVAGGGDLALHPERLLFVDGADLERIVGDRRGRGVTLADRAERAGDVLVVLVLVLLGGRAHRLLAVREVQVGRETQVKIADRRGAELHPLGDDDVEDDVLAVTERLVRPGLAIGKGPQRRAELGLIAEEDRRHRRARAGLDGVIEPVRDPLFLEQP